MTDESTRRDPIDCKMALTAVLGALAIALLFIYSAHGSMEFNPVRLPFESQETSRLLVPQGWKFFTKTADDPVILAYKRNGDGAWVSALLGANGDHDNAFGLTRRPRAQGVELGLLLEKAPANWETVESFGCSGNFAACLAAAPAIEVRNLTPHPTLCGSIGIVSHKPVPWAWSRNRDRLVMPSHIIKLEVQC